MTTSRKKRLQVKEEEVSETAYFQLNEVEKMLQIKNASADKLVIKHPFITCVTVVNSAFKQIVNHVPRNDMTLMLDVASFSALETISAFSGVQRLSVIKNEEKEFSKNRKKVSFVTGKMHVFEKIDKEKKRKITIKEAILSKQQQSEDAQKKSKVEEIKTQSVKEEEEEEELTEVETNACTNCTFGETNGLSQLCSACTSDLQHQVLPGLFR